MNRALLLTALIMLTACGRGTESTEDPTTFIAFARDFQGFEAWEAFNPPPGAGGETHVVGPFTLYLNKRPETGSTEFPLGSVIVKVANPGTPATQTFAMAKRGSNFNAKGAKNWEWFELAKSQTGETVITWRGLGAPEGEAYHAVDATCNDCHAVAASNDYVHALLLTQF
ncbi:MAG: hypothetical protein ACT4TC_13645 [Myxococcaceae bacterium]